MRIRICRIYRDRFTLEKDKESERDRETDEWRYCRDCRVAIVKLTYEIQVRTPVNHVPFLCTGQPKAAVPA